MTVCVLQSGCVCVYNSVTVYKCDQAEKKTVQTEGWDGGRLGARV